MKNSVNLTIIALGCILALLMAAIGPNQPGSNPPSTSTSAATSIYWVEEISKDENRFVNQVDGYAITIPKQMNAVDMSCPEIRSVLEDEHRRVEIYKEPTGPSLSAATYMEYSNRSLDNRTDHLQVRTERLAVNSLSARVTQWSRRKLQRIENDRNYYTCVDIMGTNAVYTFFIKSDLPLEQCGGYLDIIKDFRTFAPSRQPEPARFKHTETRVWNTETSQAFQRFFSPASEMTWGIFEPSAPTQMDRLRTLEQQMDYEFPVILMYSHVKQYPPGYVGRALEKAYAAGKLVELTLQSKEAAPGEPNMVYNILNGEQDQFLRTYAREVAGFGHPVLFRPFNEMNGDWCAYSGYHTSRDPEIFKELYKYIYRIFAEAGADNVIWIWNPNERAFPDFKWNNEVMYYPGDRYVDVVGLTGYNAGTYYPGETWRSFAEIYDPLCTKATAWYDKPMMITEFASSSVGGSKEQWVTDMFVRRADYPGIKVAIWWNGCDFDRQGNIARPYFIDETEGLTAIFRDNLSTYQPGQDKD
ncbi:MAG: glycosyl hydrolase [Syntrophomonadaceae bacterium]